MRLYLAIITVFFSLGTLQAQGDLPKTPRKIEGMESAPKPEADKNNNPLMTPDIMKLPDLNTEGSSAKSLLDMANKEVDMMQNEKFLDPGTRYKKKANRELTKDEDRTAGATSTQYLGDFKTDSKLVKIVCRDHQYVDGDRVRVFINDRIIQPNILLDSNFKAFYVELEPGFNKIDFQALNQGTSGPNTAAFAVYDENNLVLSSNMWNLATGVKATMIVVKEGE
ncbi:hypothetical protein [Robertkochia aurantiaca]|uniref:hypothetical protein n=1 Tax=Robertkochia aurantiaca TaxID=2873700 RepID=UPI001CCDBA3B|nr:hypothetical protein [Robertkochia sp. 3YJGBD-33]